MPPKQQRDWPVEQSDDSQVQLDPDLQFEVDSQDQLDPDSQFAESQSQLQQDTADWKAGQTRKVWKNVRHEAHCEKKRMKSEEDKC
jgi:hypothetical protein